MPEYINPNQYVVHLTGPDGVVIKVKPHARITLPDYFDRYRSRGFIRLVAQQVVQQSIKQAQPQAKHTVVRKLRRRSTPQEQSQVIQENTQTKVNMARKLRRQEVAKAKKIVRNHARITRQATNPLVGRRLNIDATELLRSNLKTGHFPISNNIGIGIMSYERVDPLRRLIDSISQHTDLRKTTVFISDDGSQNPQLLEYLDKISQTHNFVVLKNNNRIGIAGNSNRLIRCLDRFKYGMILNDDVEILKNDWEYFYADAMQRTGFHHFLYRQAGVYGAKVGDPLSRGGINLHMVGEKPHGAVIAFTRDMLVKCGHFDERYGVYGMEHVDWSQKAWEFGLQEHGFFDVESSAEFFKIHNEKSAVDGRDALLKEARKKFNERSVVRIAPLETSKVPEITYVVPFRNIDRNESIITVINNIRAQRFPVVHIIMVEQDTKNCINIDDYAPVFYHLAQRIENPLFNKSIAFNIGVRNTTTPMVILHDADMLTQGHYTQQVWQILQEDEACHLGGRVLYTNKTSGQRINSTQIVDHEVECERVVGYFEGGSLACTVKAYWKSGAFNEDFWGYGCEDCDFYARLAECSKWREDRSYDFLHLWHSRVSGWDGHHNNNKDIERGLRAIPIEDRVRKQYEQLRKNGYAHELDRALE
jgi:glycosyltransferase involved in cell wall biosynthesis